LRRYKYPPDKQEDAIRLVLAQAERLSDNGCPTSGQSRYQQWF
jgi:type I restriction enzyme R subunit